MCRMRSFRVLVMVFSALVAAGCNAAPIRVSAASSLTDVLEELAGKYASATGEKVVMNFGSSGSLARQIIEGAPVDVFVAADERQMDRVAAARLIVAETRRVIVSNTLVVIEPSDSTMTMRAASDLMRGDIRRIAIGDPEIVPAGAYARAYLRESRVWDAVVPKLIPLENVRAALAAVETGNVDCGFVFRSDATASHRVKVIFTLEGSPAIAYPAAVVAESHHRAAAQRFVEFLGSAEAQRIFARYGFKATAERR